MFVPLKRSDGIILWVDPGWIGAIEEVGEDSLIELKSGSKHLVKGDASSIISKSMKAMFAWQKHMAKEMLQDTEDYFKKFRKDVDDDEEEDWRGDYKNEDEDYED